MKRAVLLIFFVAKACLLFAQQPKDSIPHYPDLENPKIKQIIKLYDAKNYDLLDSCYFEILSGNNELDKQHLLTYDLAKPDGGRFDIDAFSRYNTALNNVLYGIGQSEDSYYKRFQMALIRRNYAKLYGYEWKEIKKLNNAVYALTFDLVGRNWVRVNPIFAESILRAYVANENKELFPLKDVVSQFMYGVSGPVGFSKDIIKCLSDGLFDQEAITNESEGMLPEEKLRYREVSQACIAEAIKSNPEYGLYLLKEIWKSSLRKDRKFKIALKIQPQFVAEMNDIFVKVKPKIPAVNYNEIKALDYLVRLFFVPNSGLTIQGYSALFTSKKQAFELLIALLKDWNKDSNTSLDFLGLQPAWVAHFKPEILADINQYLPLVMRYSNEFNLVYPNATIQPKTIAEGIGSLDNFMKSYFTITEKDEEFGFPTLRLLRKNMDLVEKNPTIMADKIVKWNNVWLDMLYELFYVHNTGYTNTNKDNLLHLFENLSMAELKEHSVQIENWIFLYLYACKEKKILPTGTGVEVDRQLKKVGEMADINYMEIYNTVTKKED